mmetsp:Transcript_10527/g.64592  ORF Transcript_10527/g.64592 Transcript_10527/m.64592 type:complete len:328 (+) Transcript_10527:3895-4878(+)
MQEQEPVFIGYLQPKPTTRCSWYGGTRHNRGQLARRVCTQLQRSRQQPSLGMPGCKHSSLRYGILQGLLPDFNIVHNDLVIDLPLIVILHRDAALCALPDLLHGIFHPTQRVHFALVDYLLATDDLHVTIHFDFTFRNEAARYLGRATAPKYRKYIRSPDARLLRERREECFHLRANILQQPVDHIVRLDFHSHTLGSRGNRIRGHCVECEDDRIAGCRKIDVRARDLARGCEQDAQHDFVLWDLVQGMLDRTQAPRCVRFQDNVQLLDTGRGRIAAFALGRNAAPPLPLLCDAFLTLLFQRLLGSFPALCLARIHLEHIPRHRDLI